jgi:integrase/recombinase XerD
MQPRDSGTSLAPHVKAFLTERLEREQGASRHTRASYADTLRLFLSFVSQRVHHPPSKLLVEDISAKQVLGFLEHIEKKRLNSAVTRNARLAGIRSFIRYLEFRVPASVDEARRVRAIPMKRTDTRLVSYLTTEEWRALISAADNGSVLGLRNRALLSLAVTGGLRASELVGLSLDDIRLNASASVHVRGKGRRDRELPLWAETRAALSAWLRVRPVSASRALFVTTKGRPITRAALRVIVRTHAHRASRACPSVERKRISPHVLRHTCAMIVLQATGDIRRVALWMGHSSIHSTDAYVRADPTEKLKLVEAALPRSLRRGRFPGSDKLLGFLKEQTLC